MTQIEKGDYVTVKLNEYHKPIYGYVANVHFIKDEPHPLFDLFLSQKVEDNFQITLFADNLTKLDIVSNEVKAMILKSCVLTAEKQGIENNILEKHNITKEDIGL